MLYCKKYCCYENIPTINNLIKKFQIKKEFISNIFMLKQISSELAFKLLQSNVLLISNIH